MQAMCYHLLHYRTANDMTVLLAFCGMGVSTMSHASHLIASPAMWYHSLLFLTRESVRVVVDSGDCSPRAQKSSSIAKSIVSHCFPRPAPVVLPSPEVTKSSVSHCFPNHPLALWKFRIWSTSRELKASVGLPSCFIRCATPPKGPSP